MEGTEHEQQQPEQKQQKTKKGKKRAAIKAQQQRPNKELNMIQGPGDLFPPVLRDLIDIGHSFTSRRGVERELGSTGVVGEIVASHIRMFRSVMKRNDDRPPKRLLKMQMEGARRIKNTRNASHARRCASESAGAQNATRGGGKGR